jgi:esterase/lipase superfamily enzyme
MLRWHGLLSIGLYLAILAGTAAAQQTPSRILRSLPLDKAAVTQEPAQVQQRVKRQISQPAPQAQIDERTTAESRDGTSAPARTDARQDVGAILAAIGASPPYDLSASGRYAVATDSRSGGLVVCDVANRRRLRTLENSNRRYALVEISRDARWIAAVRRDDNDRVDLWRADNGRQLGVLEAAGGAKRMLAFSADGDQLRVYGSDGQGLVFSVPDGRQIGEFGGSAAKKPTFRAPSFAPRVGSAPPSGGAAPAKPPAMPQTEEFAAPPVAPAQPSLAPKRFEYRMPSEPKAAAEAAPKMAAPSTVAPESSAPDSDPPAIDAPRMSAPKIVAPRVGAPVMQPPRMGAPVLPPIGSEAAAPPAPRAMMREEPSGEAAPGIFDNVGSALPESAAEPAFEPAAEGRAPPVAAERRMDAPAAPDNSFTGEPDESAAEIAETAIEPREGAPATASAAPSPAHDPSKVIVHFATNRNRLAPKDREWLVYFVGFFSSLPAFVIYALMLFAVLIFPWFGKRSWAAYGLATGAVVLCAMGTLEAYVRSQLRDELSGELFGSRPMDLSYGVCEVSVPPAENRQVGEVNRPVSVWVFEAPENPNKHFMLRRVDEHENKDAFLKSLSAQLETTGTDAALLFIHGYNVSFEDAVFRTAQLTVDLKFPGVPVTFSWPSYADPVKYTFDEQNAEVSIPALRELLTDLAAKSGAKRIHIIAHSMGNRVLAGALKNMDEHSREINKDVFREVVLAAPDIDSRVFKSQVLPHILANTGHCTLYASSRDRALLISRYFHNYQRLGETDPDLIVTSGMDTIDASLVDTSLLGHSYIGDVQSIVSDLRELVVAGKRPTERLGLEMLNRSGLTYWSIKPALETATDASLRR